MRTLAAIAIVLLITVIGCATGTPDDPPEVKRRLAADSAAMTPSSPEPPTTQRWVIEENDEAPNGVLSVEVSIPQLLDRKVYTIRLARKQVPADHISPLVAHFGECADGQTDSGEGIGYVGGINIVDLSANALVVEASFAGKGRDLKHVDLIQRFTIAWGGHFEGNFNGQGKISANVKNLSM